MKTRVFLRHAAVALALAALARPEAFACASCYGDPSSPVIKSMNAGIWVLLAVTGAVLAGIAAFAIRIGRRSGAVAAGNKIVS